MEVLTGLYPHSVPCLLFCSSDSWHLTTSLRWGGTPCFLLTPLHPRGHLHRKVSAPFIKRDLLQTRLLRRDLGMGGNVLLGPLFFLLLSYLTCVSCSNFSQCHHLSQPSRMCWVTGTKPLSQQNCIFIPLHFPKGHLPLNVSLLGSQ